MANVQQALAWAARGLPVFPLPYGEKRPTTSFPEQATTDPETIRQFWRDPITGSKEYNIGVLCGNGLVLFDIDTKFDKRFNRSAVDNYIAAGGHFETLTVKTASGGYQCYFRLPAGTEFANAFNLLPGVDDRCQNGYGIAPGSFSMASGGDYEIWVDKDIAEIPARLLSLLKPVKSRKDRLNGHADINKAIPLYVEYLKHVAPAIEGQGGDTHTYHVACMGVVDYGLSVPTVTNLMAEHFNQRCSPPWELDDLIRKAENAEAYHVGTVGSKDPDVLLNGVEYHAPADAPAAVPVNSIIGRIDTDDSLLPPDAIPVAQWIMHPIIAKGVVGVFVGPGGVGKSTWLIALLCHAAVGKSFGPYTFSGPTECMLYSPEDDRAHVSGRAFATCKAYNLDYNAVVKNLKVFDQHNQTIILVEMNDRKIRIPPETAQLLVDYKVKHPNCKLMVFDPFRKVTRGIEENNNTMMTEVMSHVNAIAYSLDMALLLTHHTPKNYMQRKDLDVANPDAASGAGAIVTSARIVVNILPQTPAEAETQGKRDDLISVGVVKNNHGPLGKPSWWERRILTASNGEQYPTMVPTDIRDAMSKIHQDYVNAIGDYMLSHNINALSVAQAAAVLLDVFQHGRSIKTIGDMLRTIFKRGTVVHQYVDTYGVSYVLSLDTDSKVHSFALTPLPGQPPRPAMYLPEAPQEET